ncbi:MAG: tagaturonate epimerase family protein, partial [Limisphaerales bacterium]
MWDYADLFAVQAKLGSEFRVKAVKIVHGTCLALVQRGTEKQLFVTPPHPDFEGHSLQSGILCPLTWKNVKALMFWLPELRPKRVLSEPSFGFGDRLGLATPGHVRALRNTKIFPIFAQQSVRENTRTGRTFADVLVDAVSGVFQAGWTQGFGADADHLKSLDEARNAARLGYTFFTCDPSDFIIHVEHLSAKEFSLMVKKIPISELKAKYTERSFFVPGLGELRFTKEEIV